MTSKELELFQEMAKYLRILLEKVDAIKADLDRAVKALERIDEKTPGDSP
jgi:phage terminase Nu1 subunit (DNA packaging protein)